MDILLILFLLLVAITVLSTLITNDLFTLILTTGLISVLSAVIYILLDAIDVALTEIVVGAGISMILMLITMHLTKAYNIGGYNPIQRFSRVSPSNLLTSILLLIIFLLIVDSLSYIPTFGDIHSPANNIIYKVYTKASYKTFNVQNAVTMILGSFRGYDTLGEVIVIVIGAIGVYLVLQKDKTKNQRTLENTNLSKKSQETVKKQTSQNKTNGVKKTIHQKEYVLSSAIFTLIPIILLFAFYIQFHGDFGPGGGFQAGVIVGSAYFLIILYFGKNIANNFIDIKLLIFFLVFGVLIYSGTGLITMLLGGKYLDYLVLGGNPRHSYHYGLFAIELGVGITVFAAISTIISQFYNKLKD